MIWEHISRQLEICESNIEAYELRRGFFILSDEILSTVLEYAALQVSREEYDNEKDDEKKNIVSTGRSATKLSRVCRRFRELVIHSQRLWKCVFSGMGKPNMIFTCLSRCGRGHGEVTLSTSLFASFLSRLRTCDNTPFIFTVLKRRENWGSFILQGDSDKYPAFNDFDDGRLEDNVALTKELDLPNLTQLAVRYPQAAGSLMVRSDVKFRNTMHFYSSWSTPRLRSYPLLRCTISRIALSHSPIGPY